MRIAACLTITALMGGTLTGVSNAQELLTNGDFEASILETIDGWTLDETVTGMPGVSINSAEVVGFANNPGGTTGEFGLWLRAFAGNTEGDLVNEQINAVLSQTVPASPGETYTFSGEALFEQNYAGGVAFLDLLSPSGEVPSPTDSTFRLEFLDGGGSVISSSSQDVAADVINGFGYTSVTPIVAAAPVGTVSARVVAEGTDMVFNIDPGQSAFYDNFSLTAQSDPSTELLTNGDLNAGVTQTIQGFDVEELPDGVNTLELAGFANNTPDGSQGVWLRAFAEGDASVSQTVAATPGAEYTFSAASRWEDNYSGGQVDTTTETILELAFLDGAEEVIGVPVVLDLTTEQMNDNMWRTHTLMGTAPEGAASVRVTGAATGMFNTEGGQSAFFDDFSLTATSSAIDGDFNGDGKVDNGDLNLLLSSWGDSTVPPEWVNGFVSPVDNGELNALLGGWGTGVTTAVPEPAVSLLLAVAIGLVRRR